VSAFRQATDEGWLMSYGVNIPALYRRATYFVDRILKGAERATYHSPPRSSWSSA
jgi:hypothetical protein